MDREQNETLRAYIESIKKDIEAYKSGRLEVHAYLQSIELLQRWLEERRK